MGAVLLSLAAAGTGFSALGGQGAAANLPSAKARAAALVADEVRQGERVHALTVAYLHDARVVVRLRSEVHALDRSVRSASAEYAHTTALLQQQALLSYAGGVPSGAPAGPGQADFITQADQAAYEHLAIGDLTEVLAGFDAAAARLASRLATYRAHLAASAAAERSAAAARAQALAWAESLQQLVDNARARAATLQAARLRAAATRAPAGPPQAKGLVQVVRAQLAGKAPVFGSQSPARTPQPAAGPPTPTTSSPTTLALVPVAAPTTVTTAATATTTRAPTTTTTAPPTTTTAPPTTTTAPPTTTTTPVPAAAAATTTAVPAASTTAAPPPPVGTTRPAPSTTAAGSHPPPAAGVWLELRTCESGDNYQEDTGNGFYGAYQFSEATWSGLGYSGLASAAPYWDQDAAAQHLQSQDGWAPWPACAAILGL